MAKAGSSGWRRAPPSSVSSNPVSSMPRGGTWVPSQRARPAPPPSSGGGAKVPAQPGWGAGRPRPAATGWGAWAEGGALLTYGPNIDDIIGRSAEHVDKILRGARPADLPVEQPTRFELVVNLKIARALGLTVPQSLLLRADQLIE